MSTILRAQFIDLDQRAIRPVELVLAGGNIQSIRPVGPLPAGSPYLLPGFVDAHVHVESSMLPPSEFARMSLVHGTVATVSDPHEIANVLGVDGVRFMLDDAARSPLKFCFGAPSCVPATAFEAAGAVLGAEAVAQLLSMPEIGYLSEMMNFPGVLGGDPEVLQKIESARLLGKPVDGHAPGLRGEAATRYFAAGISTDHECFTLEEAREKAALGVKILIREGSAARNFDALWPLLQECPQQVMFCSDDKHPDDLVHGHINRLVARAVAKGCDLFDVLNAACRNPVAHYRLPVGLLREGDPADFILLQDLVHFEVLETWVDGQQVAANGRTLLPKINTATPNHFHAKRRKIEDFTWNSAKDHAFVRAIEVFDGEIVTGERRFPASEVGSAGNGLQYIAVLNRYAEQAPVALGLVYGFGLREGALASSVAHDSHNIVVVGCTPEAMTTAANAVIDAGGGIVAADGQGKVSVLALPIAGLMSDLDGWELSRQYAALDAWTKAELGCALRAPFMSLSFLALPVIPKLKMTDKGLFDVDVFDFVD